MKPKREKIIDAAIDLFAEQGFSLTSTAEIATRAGVAQGTLFYHFKNKEGILHEVLHRLLEKSARAYDGIDSLSGYAAIESLLRSDLTIVQQHRQEVSVLLRDINREADTPGNPTYECIAAFKTRKFELLYRFLRQGMADGSIRDLPVEETAWFLDAAFYGVMHSKLIQKMPGPPDDTQAIQFCLAPLKP
ncbi:MAG: TetR/AcrR family transcriptional regulator [Desulfuromonadaceae bacterium]|nr:TetR/AcrR family transcriptional regulator [Desulfuromonadaceae bacterium]